MSATIVVTRYREISGVARELNVAAETIRAWERRGRIPAPIRTDAGKRLYGPEDVARLRVLAESGRKPGETGEAA